MSYKEIGRDIGKLVDEKNESYGNSFKKSQEFLKILYPEGIPPEKYEDVLLLARIFDKMMRVSTDKGAFEESPYRDIAGYGILGVSD